MSEKKDLRTMKKGQRVRIYLPEIGAVYATVIQDTLLASGSQLVHIDGTRPFDHRWISNKLLREEEFEGAYAPERVSDPALTSDKKSDTVGSFASPTK